LNAKIINFGFERVIDIDINIEIDVHIEEKCEKQEKRALSGIAIYSRSTAAALLKIHN
jgi:hypothetical protein